MSTAESQSVPETLRNTLSTAERAFAAAEAAANEAAVVRDEKARQLAAIRTCIRECEGKKTKTKTNGAKRNSAVTKQNLRPVVIKLITEKGQGKLPAKTVRDEVTALLKRRGIPATGLHAVLNALAKEFEDGDCWHVAAESEASK